MNNKQQFEVWRTEVNPALVSKLDEFHYFGYNQVTLDELWECIMFQLRKRREFIHLHELVSIILKLKPQAYMSWATAEAYKQPSDWS